MDGENLIIHLAVQDPRLHIMVMPREVLEDATRTRDSDPIRVAHEHRRDVERAIEHAWGRDELREMVEVTGTGLRNVQLWVAREDFH